MKSLVKVELNNGEKNLLNEEQVCRICPDPDSSAAIIHLSNGEIIRVIDPPFDQWENDLFARLQ